MNNITEYICNRFGFSLDVITAKNRFTPLKKIRFAICYILWYHEGISQQKIGILFNHADHTSVNHAIRWVELDTNEQRDITQQALNYYYEYKCGISIKSNKVIGLKELPQFIKKYKLQRQGIYRKRYKTYNDEMYPSLESSKMKRYVSRIYPVVYGTIPCNCKRLILNDLPKILAF